MAELVPRLTKLAKTPCARPGCRSPSMRRRQDKLELSLRDAGAAADAIRRSPAGTGSDFAVQAYGKRALPLIDWLAGVADATGRRIPVRLVKGAYWDSEIKWAQEAGLAGYPVFTRKVNTDVAYLAAARALLARPDAFYPQFATHNAHTIAAIAVLAGNRPYEFQRLYGMGEALHREVVRPEALGKPCRIYAPVGGHRICLPISCGGCSKTAPTPLSSTASPTMKRRSRRSSPIRSRRRRALTEKANPTIPLPPRSVRAERRNSLGLPLWERRSREPLCRAIGEALPCRPRRARSFPGGRSSTAGEVIEISSPQDRRVIVGTCRYADEAPSTRRSTRPRRRREAWDRAGGGGARRDARARRRSVRGGPAGADGADGARGRQDASKRRGRTARGGRHLRYCRG